MKNKIFIVAEILMIICLTSCSTFKWTSYKTLDAISKSVDITLKAYADMRVIGKIDDVTHAKVVDLKYRYERAMILAVDAVKFNLESPAPKDVIATANDLIETINSIIK